MNARHTIRQTRLCAVLMAASAPFRIPAAQTTPPRQPEPVLVAAQAATDAGRFREAEGSVREFLKTQPDSADAQYLLAYILLKENNPRASVEAYLAAGRLRSPTPLDLAAIGSDYFLMEDYAKADSWLTKSLALEPTDSLTLYLLGRTKYNLQLFAQAVPLFNKCLVVDPNNSKAAENLGLACERLGRTEEALAAYRTAISLDGTPPQNAIVRISLGALLIESGKLDEAVSVLIEGVALAPRDPRAHRELGKAYLRLGQLDKAQSELETAVRLDPQSAPTQSLLSQAYNRGGLPDKARQESGNYAALHGELSAPDDALSEPRAALAANKLAASEQLTRQYLRAHQSSADGHFLLGYILFKQKKAQASLAEYTEGAKYRTPTAYDLEVVASDYVLLNDFPDAAKWYAKAVEWDPGNFEARYYLGRAKYAENLFEDAIEVFSACLKLDPRSVKAEDNLGLALEALARTEEAMKAYRTAIAWQAEAKVKDAGPYVNLGALLSSTGHPEEALPLLLQAIQLDPAGVNGHRELGKAYSHLEQFDKARQELERAVELAPQVAAPHYLLAQTYRKLGLLDKAQAETERYRQLTSTHSSDNEGKANQAH
jgi:tetratricopeptide (TPR) repeat protein